MNLHDSSKMQYNTFYITAAYIACVGTQSLIDLRL